MLYFQQLHLMYHKGNKHFNQSAVNGKIDIIQRTNRQLLGQKGVGGWAKIVK